MKAKMDAAVEAKRFKLGPLYETLLPELRALPVEAELAAVLAALTESQQTKLRRALLRWSFFIELVKTPEIESTKYEVRWADRLGADDPRFCAFDGCVALYSAAASKLSADLAEDAGRVAVLQGFLDHSLVPFELPLDYAARRPDGGIHQAGNQRWLWSGAARRTVSLRRTLRARSHPLYAVFKKVYEKVKVKTYLTDRVLTGDHKTNREKRWEAHPESVHFALRRDCLEIERVLIESVCRFEGFPEAEQAALQAAGLVTDVEVARCPVTLAPLSYAALKAQLIDPNHGTSSFQVGHLNPLKAVNDDPTSGHTAANVAWISADGNRIQGSHTLADTQQMILEIYQRYLDHGLV